MSANVLTEIVVLKHAESVDRVLGNNWIEFYDHNGRRTDEKFPEKVLKLNEFGVPVLLPKRFGKIETWLLDPPLTELGALKSEEIGKLLQKSNFDKTLLGPYVYCSPCLCCVQTADCILRGLGARDIKIRIEPALSNWKYQHEIFPPLWRDSSCYTFSTIANIDVAYRPTIAASNCRSMETIEEFITRLNMLTRLLPIKHRDCIGMLIAHGSTISVLGKYVNTDEMKLLPADKITRIFKMVPPLTSLSLQREASGWTVKSYPLKYSPLLRPLSKDPDCIAKFGSHK